MVLHAIEEMSKWLYNYQLFGINILQLVIRKIYILEREEQLNMLTQENGYFQQLKSYAFRYLEVLHIKIKLTRTNV